MLYFEHKFINLKSEILLKDLLQNVYIYLKTYNLLSIGSNIFL